MESQLLKSLLSSETYKANQAKLKRSIFSDDNADLYDLLKMGHAQYNHDLSLDDLQALWFANHPIATNSEKADFLDAIADVRKCNAISDDVSRCASELTKTVDHFLKLVAQA